MMMQPRFLTFSRLLAIIAVASVSVRSQVAHAASTPLQTRADEIAGLFAPDPGRYNLVFAPTFLAAVPSEQLTTIFRQTFQQCGRCSQAKLLRSPDAYSGELEFEFEKGFSSRGQLALDPAPPHLVTGFFIGPVRPAARSLDDVAAQLKSLPGTASLLVAAIKTDSLKPIVQLNADTPMAIGSAFKLYVLAELIREIEAQERQWADVVPLDDSARSLPSGFLNKWPPGAPLTLYTLAALMISQSDNTAADQLIRLLGRDKIEKILPVLGHKQPDRTIPFLTTLEMFKLKGEPGGSLIAEYAAASPADRLKLLNGTVAEFSRDAIALSSKPNHITDVEWFASTSDLADAMHWLLDHTQDKATAAARKILAINPGVTLSKEDWKYVGYKGGSETGVINMTYLLQTRDNRWLTLAATWNDPKNGLDESKFFGLVQRAIELAP